MSLVHEILLREVRKMNVQTIRAFKAEVAKREQDFDVKEILLRLTPKDDNVIWNILTDQFIGINYTRGDDITLGHDTIGHEIQTTEVLFSDTSVMINHGDQVFVDRFHQNDDINHFCNWLVYTRLPGAMPFGGGFYMDASHTYVTPMQEVFNKIVFDSSAVDWKKLNNP